MQWIEGSVSWLTSINNISDGNAGNPSAKSSASGNTKPGITESFLPDDDTYFEALKKPDILKIDPNESKWAELELRKRNSEIMSVRCILK